MSDLKPLIAASFFDFVASRASPSPKMTIIVLQIVISFSQISIRMNNFLLYVHV